jgi:hypothetical protein
MQVEGSEDLFAAYELASLPWLSKPGAMPLKATAAFLGAFLEVRSTADLSPALPGSPFLPICSHLGLPLYPPHAVQR